MFLPEYVEYAERIRKSLYYGRLSVTNRPSLPFTSLSVEKFSELCRQDGLEKLDLRYASSMCYDACVTPCSLILALVYLDRLHSRNPEYLTSTSPTQVFLVAMMVASKYLYDDGEEDEVFSDEWAMSAAVPLSDFIQAEKEFLVAINGELEEVLLLQEEIRRLKVHLNGSGRECEVAGVVGNEASSSEVQSVSRCEEAVGGGVATATSSEVQSSTCYKWRVVHSNGRRIRVRKVKSEDLKDWNLFVDADAFLRAFERVESEIAWREGERRGYFTYTDMLSLTHTLPVSCTSLLNLLSHVLAVCMVGYTAAIVSIVAGTLLAQECSQHIVTVMSRLTSDMMINETTTPCLENITKISYSDQVTDSLSFITGNVVTSLDEDKDGNISLIGLPSRAITTLTTSILLAMSSPSTLRHHQHRQHRSGKRNCRACHSSTNDENCDSQTVNLNCFESHDSNLDPTDTRLSFTTGHYWPPSSHSRRYGYLNINTILSDLSHLELSSVDPHASDQKDDWVYSNPWMIPWLSWHSAPVYSVFHNFSGIGAPNMASFRRSQHDWVDMLGNMCKSMQKIVIDLIPLKHTATLIPAPLLSRVAMTYSVPDPVPWLL
nr:uncharacterized protein LOC128685788 isoform X2 [Cherax quadricarinatus]